MLCGEKGQVLPQGPLKKLGRIIEKTTMRPKEGRGKADHDNHCWAHQGDHHKTDHGDHRRTDHHDHYRACQHHHRRVSRKS